MKIEGVNVELQQEYKGTHRKVKDTMPKISDSEDYFKQYVGIWKIMFDIVLEMKAQRVLEFGTRDGFSTRIFSKALDITGGSIVTVDIVPQKDFEEKNINPIVADVQEFDWAEPVDILYIDDWHNGWHLYYELNKFASIAKVIMIHDVCLDNYLMNAIRDWCRHNWMIYTIYPMNGCGLAVIEVEKSNGFYKEDKTAGEK